MPVHEVDIHDLLVLCVEQSDDADIAGHQAGGSAVDRDVEPAGGQGGAKREASGVEQRAAVGLAHGGGVEPRVPDRHARLPADRL